MADYTIAPESIRRLRRRLQSAGPGVAADMLQDAGFATGEALFDRWRNRVAERTGLDDTKGLDAHWFGPLLAELCLGMGWGSVTAMAVGERALLLETANWAEADPGSSEHPSCHFSCGCFAAFLTAQAGAPLAVLEVECRSKSDEVCRFLAGSSETLAVVYDLLAAGRSWRDAFPVDELPGAMGNEPP